MVRALCRLAPAGAILVALLGGCVAPAPADAAPAPAAGSVAVWGDSLAWEAADYLRYLGAANGMPTEVRSFGGTAICDWFGDMRAHLRKTRPSVIVLAFSGNNVTRCMRPGGRYLLGDALKSKYANDTAAAVAIARGTGAKVLLVGAPRPVAARGDADWDRVHDAFRDVAQRSPGTVSFVDGGRLIAPKGRFRMAQACLAREHAIVNPNGTRACTRRNLIAVRAPDGAHFCPGGAPAVNGITQTCPRYSSGAFRYASTIVREMSKGVYGKYP